MISTFVDWSLAAALRATVARSARCSIPVKRPLVRTAPTRQNLPGPQPMSRTRVPGTVARSFAAWAATRTGGPLEGRELSNPGRIDLVELLVFDGPRSLVFEVVFYLQHPTE